ncbi:protein phosphatase 2C domain-containing protein [Streptosporangium sp. NBC_01756]|uniref:protein phosphatase 2C domain-containing protein n=1 Tax=Streptosporangium sp. NBC_01756 TaxID=2975950 RepID=UPI002DDAF0BD|nr:protein phosphatase 2C domain-containing protein [Streptosporangium sp. NBC_01756]WSC88251.1 protein phosphatase 2C domain-containing protein [Streptosporangium sp. NBC_01756]
MRVTFATEAAPGHLNEDFVGATPNAVVLLDGAGTPAGSESGCVHGVAWYAQSLGSALLAGLLQDGKPLTEILAEAIKAVASLHDFVCDLTHPGSPSATVVMLRHTAGTLDYLVLADSVLVLDMLDAAEPMVICDDREAQVGAAYRATMNALPSGSPEHAAAHRGYVETLRDHRNRDGGFWVAAVDPLAAEQALTGNVPAEKVRAAALLSDGASRLVDRFHLATWRQALDLLDGSGPAELIRHVREAEYSDPHGSRWPRGKAHDDATAALWKFS